MHSLQSHELLTFGQFSIDVGLRRLLKSGKKVKLSAKSFAILVELYKRRGNIVTYDMLRSFVWFDVSADMVTDHNIQQRVRAIRLAIGDKDKTTIQSESGRGYRFRAESETVLATEERSQHISSSRRQTEQKDLPIPAGFNLIVDGMIINSVAELLHDDSETRPIRPICCASYERSLEDFAFALVYASRIVTSKDFRPSVTSQDQPGKELAVRLGEICEQGIYPPEVAGGRLLHNEAGYERIRADIRKFAQCVAIPEWTRYFRDYMVREASKHLGVDSSIFQEDSNPDNYKFRVVRPYYQNRPLQNSLGSTATDTLVSFLPKTLRNSKDRYAPNALREFATRNVLSLITIMWESNVFAEKTRAWRLPHILRTLVRQQSSGEAKTSQQKYLRDIVVQHALVTALKHLRSSTKGSIVTILMNQRDEYPFKQVRKILEREHLVFWSPDPKNEERARDVLRAINSKSSQQPDQDRFRLEDRLALRRLGTASGKEYEAELYRVFPELCPPHLAEPV
jgi:DNA-binding winged helix-turn-helix (wHTH) protein